MSITYIWGLPKVLIIRPNRLFVPFHGGVGLLRRVGRFLKFKRVGIFDVAIAGNMSLAT